MKKVFRWIINAFLSMGRGDIFIKLGVHRYLPHIVVAFAICTLSIILSYLADNQLIERGLKRRELEDARINYTLKNDEMISLWRMTRVEETLKKMGSDVTAPIKPAKELKYNAKDLKNGKGRRSYLQHSIQDSVGADHPVYPCLIRPYRQDNPDKVFLGA